MVHGYPATGLPPALNDRDPYEREYHETVGEIAASVAPLLERLPAYRHEKIMERLVEPERVVSFRIPWVDDSGEVQVNRGFRVQMNSALGPYKGGLRFHPSVSQSVLKSLALEQTLKNALTGLPMGGGKGGADFQPRGKSEAEVMRFCQSFMTELFRHIGPQLDIPAGDLGVGPREIGYLFGQYKRLSGEWSGALTGKGVRNGGSLMRHEATGFGVVYFLSEMLAHRGENLAGKTVTVSGFGNVGVHVIAKAVELGARVVTIADEFGYVYDPDGISGDKIRFLSDLWCVHRRPARDYAERYGCAWLPDRRPWEVPCDIAIPTAMEGEVGIDDATALHDNGCRVVVEASNMPCTPDAVRHFEEVGMVLAPGKAANAGGVAVSGLEITQNTMRLNWGRDEVDARLRGIMREIHTQCLEAAELVGAPGNYLVGANAAGFRKVADAMLEQGLV